MIFWRKTIFQLGVLITVYSLKKANRSTYKAKIQAHPTPDGGIKVKNRLLYFREAISSWVCYDFLT